MTIPIPSGNQKWLENPLNLAMAISKASNLGKISSHMIDYQLVID